MPNKTTRKLTKRHNPWVSASPFTYDVKIENGMLLKRLDVHLCGSITFAGGASSGTSQGENPSGLIAAIKVEADPVAGGAFVGGTIVKLSPRDIIRQRLFDEGSLLFDLIVGSGGIAGAATTYTINTILPIFFSCPLLANPDDSALRLDQFSRVLLTVDTDTVVSMLVGNDRTVTATSLNIDVVEHREFAPEFMPTVTLFQDSKAIPITGGAQAEFAIDSQLPKDQAFLHALFIAETTNEALSDAVINKVRVLSGSDEVRSLYEDHIKGEQESYIKDQAAVRTGLYFLPIAEGGRISNALANVSFILDVSNPGTDRVIVVSRRIKPRLK